MAGFTDPMRKRMAGRAEIRARELGSGGGRRAIVWASRATIMLTDRRM